MTAFKNSNRFRNAKTVKCFQTMKKYKEDLLMNRCLLKTAVVVFTCLIFIIVLIQLIIHRDASDDNACLDKVVRTYNYKRQKGQDVSDKDFLHVQASDLKTIQKVCDLFDDCAAFNSNGWLKKSAKSHTSAQADLYVKQAPKTSSRCKSRLTSTPDALDYSDMVSKLKIFVYPTVIGHEHRPHRAGGYTIERKFVEILSKSKFLTKNGNDATFFFIPIRCTSYIINATSEHLGIIQARQIVGEMLEEIKNNYPYWSWSNGADHFYICAHEIGAGIGEQILKNAVALVNTADYDDPYFIPHKDISIPPTPTSGSNVLAVLRGGSNTENTPRDVLAFFAGDLRSGRVRPSLYSRWSRDEDIVLVNHELPYPTYLDYLKKSKFCLIVRGREAWSPRLFEAIFAGCVPVIISNQYHLPLQDILDWKTFSIIIPEFEIDHLKELLEGVAPSRLYSMQAQLAHVYTYFVWNNPPKPHDAFYSVLLQLWRRRHVTQYRSVL